MRLDEECRLSFYQQIASLNEDHGVYLVQNISDKKIYVKKILKIVKPCICPKRPYMIS